MIKNKTVIISCAGMGNRLGLGMTKALLNIDGKTLIEHTLENLKDVDDVRIVVGFQAEKVIETVLSIRKNVTFAFNHNYRNNGTAASVSAAIDGAKEYVVTIDGDTIIHPDDYKKILGCDGEFVCGCTKSSNDNPVLLSVNNQNKVTEFSRMKGDYEWTGVSCISSKRLKKSEKHVYQMLEPLLPIDFMQIRTKEIDTLQDYQEAKNWVLNDYKSL